MKLPWTEEEPEFKGEFCSFRKVCSYPKPLLKPAPTDYLWRRERAGTRRAGEVGDGWFGVNVTHDEAKAKIERIRQYAQAAGRDPGKLHFSASSVPAAKLMRTVDEVNDREGLCTKSSCLWKLTSTLRVSSASLRTRYARCFRTIAEARSLLTPSRPPCRAQ
jgi:Luciferase-like monooxygenase